MIVIIEGLDGVGKSTIMNRLINDTKVPFISIHEGYPGEEPGIRLERFRQLKDNLSFNGLVCYDRCTCIDDFVYNILNKTTSELTNHLDEIKQVLKKCLIVHLELDKDVHLSRFNSRGDEFIKSSQFDDLNSSYDQFYKDLDLYRVKLTGDLDRDVKVIEAIIDKEGLQYEN